MLSIEQQLEQNGIYVGLTKGVSMRPMLREGKDTIVISPVSGRLKKYDVPLYRKHGSYVLHRVVEVTDKGYVICGDNCAARECDVTDDMLVGVLSGFRRGEKYVPIDSKGYLAYVKIWVALYPVRRLCLRLRAFAGRIYRRIFKRNK